MRRFALLVAGLTLLAGVVATVSGGATQAKTRWVITDLGTLGGKESRAAALNEGGQIVGGSTMPRGEWHAFLWQNGGMADLGTLGGRDPRVQYGWPHPAAVAINERGQIVGRSATPGGTNRAFLWENGEMTGLGRGSGGALDINEGGQIVGWSAIGRGSGRAFLWHKGRTIYLGTLGGTYSKAVAINERGQIVGVSATKVNAYGEQMEIDHAFLWENGNMRDLGTLGGRWSEAVAINDHGQIVGESDTKSGWSHAFLWQNGKMRDLGTLGGPESGAVALNDRGQIIGESDIKAKAANGDPISHAFLWENGKMRDLGDFVPRAINDRGQVVGERHTRDRSVAVVWQAGRLTDLGLLPGTKHSLAVEINGHDQIVGWITTNGGKDRAVLWTLRRG